MRILALIWTLMIWGSGAMAAENGTTFNSIDGGTLDLADWAGRPVLVVNTASQCGFTPQYRGLQELYDTYREAGLVVLAVPSDDFNQELEDAGAVKDFCEINYGLDLPMTDITPVRGAEAGFSPRWNFNKVLIGPDGAVLGTWGATTRPTARPIIRAVEAALGQG